MDDLTNRVIKGYEFKECIGAGGFGAVYRAYQPAVGREVAIKVILPQHANEADFIRRFEVEAQLVARLENPHIVPLYDYWREPDGAFLVMRWLRGNLRGALQRGPWSIESTLRLLEQIAAALTVAHREGVIHRDIKPDNILLDEDDNAYLADFGIAKNLNVGIPEGNLTQEGAVVGSPAYITPEQIRGDVVTPRTDIYSLGVVLYELLVGEKPYADANTPYELIAHHLNTSMPALHVRRPNLPAALNEVLQTATAKDPAQRYANALRFAAAFRAALPNLQRAVAQPLAEPLTERELDIIRLMIEGLSNAEIAQRLVVSAATVKWYVQQIYAKLDVHSRRQAVDRAKQLNLNAHTPIPAALDGDFQVIQPIDAKIAVAPDLTNPYKGLRAFQEADAVDFFGRAALTEQLLARLAEGGDGARFLAVIGPSGSGKSSVVRAGLIPALRRGGLQNSKHWFITEMLPGTHPLEELEAALLRVASSPQSGLLSQLSEDRRGLVRAVKRILPSDQDTELLLVIDQFEELFTLLDDETLRSHFIDILLSAATDSRSRLRIVLTLRADFYDKPLLYPRLAELVRSHTEIMLPLSSDELERAIAGPAERVGLALEPGLVAAIIHDVGEQPGTLPLLQYALTELYERREERKLTLQAYRTSGGIRGALARRADELYDDLDKQAQAAARQLFLRLVTLGEGTEDTRRRALLAELEAIGDPALDEVINSFALYRLLTFDRDPVTRGPTVEIAHEALIREWAQLREWLVDSREELHIQRRLMTAAEDWNAAKRESSFLASGARLIQFEALAANSDLVLNRLEREYLQISMKEREAREGEEAIRQERELTLAHEAADAAQQVIKSQRRATNRLRYLVAALAVFLLVAVGLSGVALNSRSDALAQKQAALSSAATSAASSKINAALNLAADAKAIVEEPDSDPTLAALLSIRSLNSTYSFQADNALESVAASDFYRDISGHIGDVNTVAFSTDGEYLLTGGNDDRVVMWDKTARKMVRQFQLIPDNGVRRAIFSPDGKYIMIVKQGIVGYTSLFLLNSSTGEVLHNGNILDFISSVAFSPDGRYLLANGNSLFDVHNLNSPVRNFQEPDIAWGDDGVFSPNGNSVAQAGASGVQLWDVATGSRLHHFDHTAPVNHVAYSPDGKLLLTSTVNDNLVHLWDIQSSSELRTLAGHTSVVNSIAFSPDGTSVLTGSADNTVRLWGTTTGQELRRLQTNQVVHSAAFSPDGQFIVAGLRNGLLRLWKIQSGWRQASYSNALSSLAVSPNGKYIATGSADGNVEIWLAATGELQRIFQRRNTAVRQVAFSPDGQLLVDAQNIAAVLWGVGQGDLVQVYSNNDQANSVTFSPGGKYLVTASADKTARVWDIQNGSSQEFRRFTHSASVLTAAFSPDGKYVVTTGTDKTARVWDVQSGQESRHFGSSALRAIYSPDGKYILTGSDDSGLHLWDAVTSQEIRQFIGHSGRVTPAAFSPDAQYILSIGVGDNTARVWDFATGQEIRRFINIGLSDAKFSPDGKYVYTTGNDKTIRLWNMNYQDLMASVCARLLRDFTDAERTDYHIDDKEPTCPQFGGQAASSTPTETG